jgi:hypothetical protein
VLSELFDAKKCKKIMCLPSLPQNRLLFDFYLQPEKALWHSNNKNWIDSGAWQHHYTGFHLMPEHEQEIKEAVLQSAAGLLPWIT